ncbi:MAG: substrate-binding domain-containing protein, partial [Vulcanococcus sp.]
MAAPAPSVQGAGATFPAPLYQRWFTHLLVRKGLTIGYEPMGSSEGEDQLDQGLVDFAGSDRSAFNGTQTSLTPGRWLRIPMVAGAIAVAYNNPDCRLRLSRDQLRQVFAGQIKTFKAL